MKVPSSVVGIAPPTTLQRREDICLGPQFPPSSHSQTTRVALLAAPGHPDRGPRKGAGTVVPQPPLHPLAPSKAPSEGDLGALMS